MLSQYEKPRIVIKRAPQVADRLVKALCSGIEEEMIPYALLEAAGGQARELAFSAAEASRLEVGLGITPQATALGYAKLPPGQPLFALEHGQYTEEELRTLGANAARLVKGIPFKEA